MDLNQLPETFSIATTMSLKDIEWAIEEAIPENAVDFIKSKSLILKMRKVQKLNPDDIWYSLPTISNEFPLTNENENITEFDTYISDDDYRQAEFLNPSLIHLIDTELVGIKNIWQNFSKKGDDYTLFKNCHVRDKIGKPDLKISFIELINLLNVKSSEIGTVKINDKTLDNSFSFKTESTSFYGRKSDGKIIEFCISQSNENSNSDISAINLKFNLLFVDWCNMKVHNSR
ncbi:MAG: hypothetical protein EOO46_12545 [Flavobacterium sp.]|nr:MAG: hypothetical protein EOO46_12545 [Flavobacterium sp.]